MPAARTYTAAEAAAVSGVAVKAVHNAIDKRIVELQSGLRSTPRQLTRSDLLRLKLWYGIGPVLAADRRQKLFEAIEATPQAQTVRADDLLIVDVGAARKQLDVRIQALEDAEAAIHRNKDILGGEPVFRGTRVPVRLIAAMLAQGADRDEILDGYPSLTPRMLELATIWTAAHPARGRPRGLSEQGLQPISSQRLDLKGDPLVRRSAVTA